MFISFTYEGIRIFLLVSGMQYNDLVFVYTAK